MIQTPTFLSFDGMTAPNPADPNEVEWKLRYGRPSREDLRIAAAFICAFKQLVSDSQRTRNAKVAAIRKAAREARRG